MYIYISIANNSGSGAFFTAYFLIFVKKMLVIIKIVYIMIETGDIIFKRKIY